MEKNNERIGSSEMGVEDSGPSSIDCIQFQNIERLINLVLDDCPSTTEPTTSSCLNVLLEERLRYFHQVAANILKTKNNFACLCNKINKNIDEMIQKLIYFAEVRKQQLKSDLTQIAAEKVANWDRQLNACSVAVDQLQRNALVDRQMMLLNCRSTSEIGFIDAGDIQLEQSHYTRLLRFIQKLGNIKYYDQCISDSLRVTNFIGIAPKFTFGSGGSEPGQLCRAWGVCSDLTGRILVCDRSNHRIQIFNECGEFLMQFGKEGFDSGEFNRPSGIEVDSKNRIIVADKDNHRIQVFTFFGSYLFQFGTEGSRPGQFLYPWDVAANSKCEIAVSDSKNHRVQLFNKDGAFLALFDANTVNIKNYRRKFKFLDSPRGVAFRPDGTLLVTDFNNHQVLILSSSFKQFSYMGGEGSSSGQFFRPQGIACDSKGNFVVSDSKNYRIQMFAAGGRVIKTFGTQGNEPGEFDCPQGICFHPNSSIIVVDFNNNRVQVF